MKIIDYFNKYSLITLVTLIFLPFIYLIPKTFSSYFEALDKLSIPLGISVYSFFWIKFNSKIEKDERSLSIVEKRVEQLKKINNKEYFKDLKADEIKLANLKGDLIVLKFHLGFINKALRISAIFVGVLKFIQVIYSLTTCKHY